MVCTDVYRRTAVWTINSNGRSHAQSIWMCKSGRCCEQRVHSNLHGAVESFKNDLVRFNRLPSVITLRHNALLGVTPAITDVAAKNEPSGNGQSATSVDRIVRPYSLIQQPFQGLIHEDQPIETYPCTLRQFHGERHRQVLVGSKRVIENCTRQSTNPKEDCQPNRKTH